MLIKGIQKLSLIEYPGKISAIVWVGNCNFRCPFCYNSEMVLNHEKMGTIPEEEVIEFMSKRKGLIDGIAITGGEPTLQKDLPEFAKKIKDLGFLVMLETNGSNPNMIKELIDKKLVDYIAMDIKAPLDKYNEVTKGEVNKENIKKSVDIIRNSGIDYEFRTTILPRFFKEEDVRTIGEWLKGSKSYYLQQFIPEKTIDESFRNVKPYPFEKLEEFAELMKPYFEFIKIRQ